MSAATFLTVNEAAAHWQVHHRTVRTWIAQGQLQAYRVGGHVRLRAADVENFARPIPTAKRRRTA